MENADEVSVLGSFHAAEVDKSWEQISAEKEAWKRDRISAGGDTIMNPNTNYFERDLEGYFPADGGRPSHTHTGRARRISDERTFNRNRQ